MGFHHFDAKMFKKDYTYMEIETMTWRLRVIHGDGERSLFFRISIGTTRDRH